MTISSETLQKLAKYDTPTICNVIELFDVQWASSSFQAGDVMIFGMYLMHASLENSSGRYRLSSDTRYQLASEAVDERHMGEHPDRIPKGSGRPKSFQQARDDP